MFKKFKKLKTQGHKIRKGVSHLKSVSIKDLLILRKYYV